MTDFGADHGFGHVPKKLQEHYGITIAVSTVRKITEGHGEHMREQQEQAASAGQHPRLSATNRGNRWVDGADCDESGTEAGDKRKQKTLQWQEARLVMVHAQGSVTPKFAATFGGSVEESGQALLPCAVAAGFGTNTQVPWGRGRGRVDSRAIRRDVWLSSQLSGRFLPCLRLSGGGVENLCARRAPGLDGNPEAAFEK